jgi:capsular exopolysaccharide synthesis family protein
MRGPMDFRMAYHAVLERLWLVMLIFVIGTVLTAVHLHRAPRIYLATSTLEVEQQEEKVVKFDKIQQTDLLQDDMVQTIVQTIPSRPVLEHVVRENQLTKVFASPGGMEATVDQAVGRLGGMVNVKLRRGTRLIDAGVAGTNPALCEKLANSLLEQYIRFTFEQQAKSAQVASKFLLDEAARLKGKLQESETKLQAYKEEKKSISLEDRHDIVTARLKELSQRVNEAKNTRTRLEIQNAAVQALGTNVTALMALPAIAEDKAIAEVSLTFSKLQNDFSSIQQRYKERHPKYIQAYSQLKDWGDTLTNEVLKAAQTVKVSYEGALTTERALEKALKEQETQALELSKLGVQYNVLQREIESDRALYDAVLTRLKETSLTKDLKSDQVRILQFATTPTSPVSPNVGRIMLLGLIGSLAAGIALVLGIRTVDTTIKTVDEAERMVGLPTLGAVQYLHHLRDPRKQLVVREDAQSAGAEAFRSLRTSIFMLGRQENRRTLLFTSAIPGEGKTFCSVNYAMCLAQAGQKTVLIDADLRRPAVERAMTGQRTESHGVTDFLTGQKGLQDIIRPGPHENMFYIPAGTTAPNPAELLAQGGFAALLEEVLRKCDRIVVDSAPVHAVSDTLLLAPLLQTVILVIRAGRTPWKASARAIEAIQKSGVSVSGLVLNGIRVPRLGGYGYDTYYYYSYNKGYGRKGVYGEGQRSPA